MVDLRFLVALSFYGNFVEGENSLKPFSYKFFVIISLALLQSGYFNLLRLFQIILFLTNFTQIHLNRYERVSSFMEFSVNGKKQFKTSSHKLCAIISFALGHSNYFNFFSLFQIIVFLTNFIQIPSLNRYEKI